MDSTLYRLEGEGAHHGGTENRGHVSGFGNLSDDIAVKINFLGFSQEYMRFLCLVFNAHEGESFIYKVYCATFKLIIVL